MKKELKKEKRIEIRMIVWYFSIFSIIGLLTETIYCYITTGVLENRQGLIWGPFCPIYGVGATIFIILLEKYEKHPIKLFIAGVVLGGIIEYILSYAMEAMYGNRFWDYSYTKFHINGRICVTYSIFWGILAIALIQWVRPFIDKWIYKIDNKIRRGIEIGVCIFLIIDAIATVWAIESYTTRAYEKYTQERGIQIEEKYEKKELMKKIEKMGEELFPDEMMIRTFPNLRIYSEEKEEIWVRDVVEGKF